MKFSRVVPRNYHPMIWLLFAGTLVVSTVQSMCGPFLAIYLGMTIHMNMVTVGAVIGVMAIFGTVGGFVGSTLSDRFGRVQVMVGSLWIQTGAYLGIALCKAEFILCVLLCVSGFFGAFFNPTSKALIADLTPSERRLRVFSSQYVLNNIGVAVGPIIGASVGIVGGAIPFAFMAIIYLMYSIAILGVSRASKLTLLHVNPDMRERTFRNSIRVVVADKALLLFVLGGIFFTTVEGQWSAPISQFLGQHFRNGNTFLAAILTTNAVTVVLLQPLLSPWMQRQRALHMITTGGIFAAAGFIIFSFANNLMGFITAMFVFSIGEVLVIPSEYVMIDEITPETLRGAYYGTRSFTTIGNFTGPFLCDVILAHFGGTTMFIVMACIAVISIFIYWSGHRITGTQAEVARVSI